MTNYTFSREIPVNDAYDLLVAGGGPAGCAAAICAARLGIKVLLVEATGCLGGMSTSGLVTAFDPMANGEQMLVGGFMRELVETMWDRGFIPNGVTPDYWRKLYHKWTPFNPEGLKVVLDEKASKAGVDTLFYTRVIDADVDPKSKVVRGVIIQHVDGYEFIKAKTFVDATGDAILTALCGAPYREAFRDTPDAMPPTLCAIFGSVDWDKLRSKEWADKPDYDLQTQMLNRAIEEKVLSQPDRHLPGLWKIGDQLAYSNSGHIFHTNSVNIRSLTAAMVKGRQLVQEYLDFYRRYFPGCEKMELATTGALLGVRESRRIVGEYELSIDDYLAQRQFPDQIGVFNKFVDIHVYEPTKEEWERFQNEKKKLNLPEGAFFGIPYGILVPQGWQNLWAAGRCNSSDVYVHGSIRVQPAAAMMGQAVGTAAVQSIQSGQPACDLDTEQLIQSLRKQNAYLPQSTTSKRMSRR